MNVNTRWTVTRADGSVHHSITTDLPGLDTERLGKVTALLIDVAKHAKATGGAGDLTLTLAAVVDGVAAPDGVVKLDPAKLRQVQRIMFKGFLGLIDYEDARAKRGKP